MDAVILSADGAIEYSFGDRVPLVGRGLSDAQVGRLAVEVPALQLRIEAFLEQTLGYPVRVNSCVLGCRFEKRA